MHNDFTTLLNQQIYSHLGRLHFKLDDICYNIDFPNLVIQENYSDLLRRLHFKLDDICYNNNFTNLLVQQNYGALGRLIFKFF